MDRLKSCLTIISAFTLLLFAMMFLDFLRAVYKRARYKQPIPWREFNPFAGMHSLSGAVLPVILMIGLLNLIGAEFFAKEEIGAFYEKPSYQVDYDALLEVNGGAEMFCIATIKHEEGYPYRVVKLAMPYGKTQCPEAYFDEDDSTLSITLGNEGWSCKLTLGNLSTKSSYSILKSYVVSNYGEFCASKRAGVYHTQGCGNIKKIKSENLVHFQKQRDAEVLGYTFCKSCRQKY